MVQELADIEDRHLTRCCMESGDKRSSLLLLYGISKENQRCSSGWIAARYGGKTYVG